MVRPVRDVAEAAAEVRLARCLLVVRVADVTAAGCVDATDANVYRSAVVFLVRVASRFRLLMLL
jgi:hypothetical protein